MERIALGEFTISRIIFGAWAIGGWYWGGTDDSESKEAIASALDSGITTFDTAPMYGFGHSETILGQALQGRRDQVEIATKCGLRWDSTQGTYFFDAQQGQTPHKIYRNLTRESILHECELSLKRLNTDYIDLYQCHWPDQSTALEETADALLRLKEQGKIRAIGVSNFTAVQIDNLRKLLPITSDQPKYNLLDQEVELGVLPYTIKHKIALLVYGPLAQGLLTGKINANKKYQPGDYRQDKPRFQTDFLQKLQPGIDLLNKLGLKYKTSAGNIAIAWLLQRPGVSAAICGIRNKWQAWENSLASTVKLTSEDWENIKNQFNSPELKP